MISADVVLETDLWSDVPLSDLAQKACAATLMHLGLSGEYEMVVMGCDNSRISELNAAFRGKDQPTNVLSWPSQERGAGVPGGRPHPPTEDELGDIAIAFETCKSEAKAQNIPLDHHVLHLLVHGTLHLLGYDHENDADAALMEGIESNVLESLNVPDPYKASDTRLT